MRVQQMNRCKLRVQMRLTELATLMQMPLSELGVVQEMVRTKRIMSTGNGCRVEVIGGSWYDITGTDRAIATINKSLQALMDQSAANKANK